jgi:hypothetical protein
MTIANLYPKTDNITKPTRNLSDKCHRCGGTGMFPSAGRTCYRCLGDRRDPTARLWSVPASWTDEQIVAWHEAREARNAKSRARSEAKRIADRNAVWTVNVARFPRLVEFKAIDSLPMICDDIIGKASKWEISDAQYALVVKIVEETLEARAIQAAKPVPQYLAVEVGDKVEVEGTVIVRTPCETRYGISLILVIETVEGNQVKTFGTADWLWGTERGDAVKMSGTVKDLAEYQDVKQTILTRTKGEVLA